MIKAPLYDIYMGVVRGDQNESVNMKQCSRRGTSCPHLNRAQAMLRYIELNPSTLVTSIVGYYSDRHEVRLSFDQE